jgi:hypothetical protein
MVEKEHLTDEVASEKPTPKLLKEHVAVGTVAVSHQSRRWMIGVVAAVISLFVVIVIGSIVFNQVLNNRLVGMGTNGGYGHSAMMHQFGEPSRVAGEQTFSQTATTSDGLTSTSTTTTYTQTQGVVTAVSGDSITVAGGGKTLTVKTTSATTYANDSKPVVNDTVVIIGTKDGSTITATQIAVNN